MKEECVDLSDSIQLVYIMDGQIIDTIRIQVTHEPLESITLNREAFKNLANEMYALTVISGD